MLRNLLFVSVAAISLAACNSTSLQNNLDTARAAYDAGFLTPAAKYRQLGYCATGTKATAAHPCADRQIVAMLRSENTTVIAAFNAWQAQITAGNTAGANAAYAALQTAVAAAMGTIANVLPLVGA